MEVRAGEELLPVGKWTAAVKDAPAEVRRLVTAIVVLLEEERCVAGARQVVVPHDVIARLPRNLADGLGLPPVAPHALRLEGIGAITDANFRVDWEWLDENRRRVAAFRRIGAFLEVAGRRWRLEAPVPDLLDRLDAGTVDPGATMEQRVARWSDVARYLPQDAVLDGYLRSTKIVTGTAFTLDLHAGADGEFTFDPVVVRSVPVVETDAAGVPDSPEFVNVLPAGVQTSWAGTFRRFRSARPSYAVEGGWYLLIPQDLRDALEVVRRKMDSPPDERRAFARNPYAGLREALGDRLDESVLEKLFFEPPDYGARVAEAGIWKPKELPVPSQGQDTWLPPEEEAPAAPEVGAGTATGPGTGEGPESPGDRPARIALLLGEGDNLSGVHYSAAIRQPRKGQRETPKGLKSVLKPHQDAGVRWLQDHWLAGCTGALLADDMGLGKTLQCLAFLAWVRDQPQVEGTRGGALIVAPTGLLMNWEDEVSRHLDPGRLGQLQRAYGPSLRTLRHSDAPARVRDIQVGAPVLDTQALQRNDVVLTTFETMRDYAHSFGRIPWTIVVFDEAQKIKNPAALVTEEAKAVASNAEFVITMTGTPVENRMADLWSIVDACQPGVLGSMQEFCGQYESSSGDNWEAVERLGKELSHDDAAPRDPPRVLLRRLKEDHIPSLPPKRVRVQRIPMPTAQASAYDRAVARARAGEPTRGHMLSVLHELRSISLHPDLGIDGREDEKYIQDSARLMSAIGILDGVHEARDKALVFVESRAMQGVLSVVLRNRYALDSPPLIINGAVAGDDRKRRVDTFQSRKGFDVMLLSPKAGGVGLTLTAATHVIHLSRWWNPAVEDQCTDRVYRIGQDRPVTIHVPLAIHPLYGERTFDERLHQLLERKRELSRRCIGLAPGAGDEGDVGALFGGTVGQGSGAHPG